MEWDWLKGFLRENMPAVWRVCHAVSAKKALWILLFFIAIGLLQTLLAYEAGVLAVDALPSDVAGAGKRRHLRRFFLGSGLALFVMTACIGLLNDAAQKDLGDSVSTLLVATKRSQSFLESLTGANLPRAKQEQLSEIEKENRKAIAIGSFSLRKAGPVEADLQAPAAAAPVEVPDGPRPTKVTPPVAPASPDVPSSPAQAVANPPRAAGGNPPPTADGDGHEPKPVQYVMELDSLQANRVNRQESWEFFAGLNGEKGFCRIDWAVTATEERISLRDDQHAPLCPVHDLPLSGEIRLYVETYASLAGKMRVFNYNGHLRRDDGDGIVTSDGVLLQAKGQSTTPQEFTLRLNGEGGGDFVLKGRIRQK